MRALEFAAPNSPPFGLVQLIGAGQSNESGVGEGAVSTTQPFSNVMTHDSSGSYTDPNASTWLVIPLVAPQRPAVGGSYPNNVAGESTEVGTANEITRLALASGYPGYRIGASCTGVSGAAMTNINKPTVNYEAAILEAQVFKRLAAGIGASSFGVGGVVFVHGEADSGALTPAATYQGELIALQANYQTDLQAITGQTRPIPLIACEQHSEPNNFTAVFGPSGNSTGLAMLNAHIASLGNPGALTILGFPTYQYPYNGDNVHRSTYQQQDDKFAQIYLATERYLNGQGLAWRPLRPLSFVRVGNVVTITYDVPVGPLVFDTTSIGAGPHTAGPWAPFWASGKGFEAYEMLPTPIGASSTSPIVIQFASPHGLTTGDPIGLSNIDAAETQGHGTQTAANGVFACTVVDPTHASLNGSTSSGTYATGGSACVPISITSAVVVGNTVVLTLSRAPTAGRQLYVGYADQGPMAYGIAAAGLNGRYGCLRDSDPFVGASGFANRNWAVSGAWAVA